MSIILKEITIFLSEFCKNNGISNFDFDLIDKSKNYDFNTINNIISKNILKKSIWIKYQNDFKSLFECSICTEIYNKNRNRVISCSYCFKNCCSDCFYMFLTNNNMVEPECMFCKKTLSKDFTIENMTKIKYESYYNYKIDLLFSREKSKLPEAQYYVTKNKKINNLDERILKYSCKKNSTKLNIKNLNKMKSQLCKKKNTRNEISKCNKKIKIYRDHLKKINAKINILKEKKYILQHDKPTEEIQKISVNKPCPTNDCRGFLAKNKCNLCEKKFCGDCYEEKLDDHICDENLVKSIKLLKKDTKNCPNCGVLIHRTEGCSQMFCIKCHVAFDWNTLRIDKGHIHNPEYFRYLRENNMEIPRNPYDNPQNNCERLIDIYDLIGSLKRINTLDSETTNYILNFYRSCSHMFDMFLTYGGLPRNPDDNLDTLYLRINYLEKIIDENQWKKIFKMRVKRNERLYEIRLVIDIYYNVLKDIFRRIYDDPNYRDKKIIITSLQNIYDYTYNQIETINKKYNSKCKKILNSLSYSIEKFW